MRSLPREQPVGVGVGDLDEAQDRLRRDGQAPLVFQPGPEGDIHLIRQERAAVLSKQVDSDKLDPSGEVDLDDLPVFVRMIQIHGDVISPGWSEISVQSHCPPKNRDLALSRFYPL